MNEMKYLLVSHENFCVYTFTPRKHTALALAEGDSDIFVFGATYANMNAKDYESIWNRDLFYDKTYNLDLVKNELNIVDDTKISQSWLDKRVLIRSRQELFFAWETHTTNANLRTQKSLWENLNVYIEQELDKCVPKINQYTWAIEEWARIIQVPVKEAYKELKLQVESDKLKRFRIEAMAEKWKRTINAMTNIQTQENIKAEMVKEFWLNAWI
jgi:hypothetical protein